MHTSHVLMAHVLTGNIQVTVEGSQAEASTTGLEGSAKSGKGHGIQPFRHRAQAVPALPVPSQSATSGEYHLLFLFVNRSRLELGLTTLLPWPAASS